MDFQTEVRVSHPADRVLAVMIDQLEKVVSYLPSIVRIEMRSRTEEPDGRLLIDRTWEASARTAPRAVRPFLSQKALTWLDKAEWVPREYKVNWSFKTSLSGLFDCGGTNWFEPHPSAPETETRMRITGKIAVHPERVPGVPRFLARRLAPQIERFVIGMILPNLTELGHGLQRYLDSQEPLPAAAEEGGERG